MLDGQSASDLRSVARRARHSLGIVALALLAGCAVGPDFQRPSAPDVTGYTPEPLPPQTASASGAGAQSQHFVRGLDLPGEWWKLFHSKALTSLTEKALEANPDLQAAQAALRVARENVYAQRGALFPSVDGNFAASRQKAAADAFGNPADPSIFNLFTGQLSVSYTPDVFGGTRRSIESLDAQADAQRFQLEATYLTLTSNLAGAAVQEASLRGQIAATQKIIKIASDLLDLLRRQRGAGQVAEADVVAQEASLAQVQQSLSPLQKQLAQQRNLLAALSGRFPSEEPKEKFEFAALQLPRDLPVSLPLRLVEQRPDVRQAEANLHSAGAQIGVAIANRLPNITLTATSGSTAFAIEKLSSPDTGFWSIAGSVTQPIFHGGTLFHRELAAKAAFDQAAAQYRGTVIIAFQNVADALRALQADAVAMKRAVDAERAAERSLTITRQRMELGDINYLGLLNAQQTYQQALINLVQAKASRYADTVALFQALGGGWWNRSDVAPEQASSIADFLQSEDRTIDVVNPDKSGRMPPGNIQ
jgi:NodT family efflux transporter outer membrane factor (OMF) lipoprotein